MCASGENLEHVKVENLPLCHQWYFVSAMTCLPPGYRSATLNISVDKNLTTCGEPNSYPHEYWACADISVRPSTYLAPAGKLYNCISVIMMDKNNAILSFLKAAKKLSDTCPIGHIYE